MAMDCLHTTFSLLAEAATPAAPPQAHLDTSTWVALALGVAATMYVMYRAKQKSSKDPLERRESSVGLSQQRAAERQMSNLLVELSEMARTLSAGLDTRAAKLSALLDVADERIAELKQLQSAGPASPGATGSASGSATGSVSGPPVRLAEDSLQSFVQRQSRASDSFESAAPPAASDAEQHAQVYALADQQRSVAQIAAELGRPNGEIELILALRPRNAG